MRDHVWEWCDDRCVTCGLTAAEITASGREGCTAYVPDDFSGEDPEALWRTITEASRQ